MRIKDGRKRDDLITRRGRAGDVEYVGECLENAAEIPALHGNDSALFSRFVEIGRVRNSHLGGHMLGKLRNDRTYLLAFPAVGHCDMSDPIGGVIYQRIGVGAKGRFRQYTYVAASQCIFDAWYRLRFSSAAVLSRRTEHCT